MQHSMAVPTRKININITVALGTWKHNPSDRFQWPHIQHQIKLIKQLEQLRMREHELLLHSKSPCAA